MVAFVLPKRLETALLVLGFRVHPELYEAFMSDLTPLNPSSLVHPHRPLEAMDAIAPILHAAVTKIALIFRPPSPRLMLPHAEVLIPTATLKDIGLEDLCPVESLSTWTSTTTLPSIAPSSFSTKLILVALFTSLTIFALGLGALFIVRKVPDLAARTCSSPPTFQLFRLYALAARAHQLQINSLKEQVRHTAHRTNHPLTPLQLAAKDTLIANKDTLLADKDTQLATRDAQITSQSDDLTAKAYQLFAKDVAAAALRQQIVALEADVSGTTQNCATIFLIWVDLIGYGPS